MEPTDVNRLKSRADEILRTFFGFLSVWGLKFTSLSPENDKIKMEGFFYEDFEETKRHKFFIILDRYGKLHDCKIS